MCGRYAFAILPSQLETLFGLHETPADLRARYNIAPTQVAPVIRIDPSNNGRVCSMLRWGLIPKWAKDPAIASSLINARCETAADKPAFRAAYRSRRCLVPATGFYEWKKTDGRTKQPYFIYRDDQRPIAMAGLWETWTEPASSNLVETFTILTTTAKDAIRSLHDRMPVIIPPEHFDHWLQATDNGKPGSADSSDGITGDPRLGFDENFGLEQLADPVRLVMHPVASSVSSVKSEGPDLIRQAEPRHTTGTLFDLD
jgi:putative SOS response-associated peptidase YedK